MTVQSRLEQKQAALRERRALRKARAAKLAAKRKALAKRKWYRGRRARQAKEVADLLRMVKFSMKQWGEEDS
jgi:hypothetical protein